ncbi:MAG: DUF1467 family protein [Rhodospirillales bacterium]|nr:DUF1467 family protein [Rhodospirillales bacterium]
MGLYAGLTVYVVIWWMVLFMVLPWGIQPIDAADVEKGHASGAPRRPRIVLKVLITTVTAAAVWMLVWGIIRMDLISFR